MVDILLIGLIAGLIVWLLKQSGPIGIAVTALAYMFWFYTQPETKDSTPADPIEISDSIPTDLTEMGDGISTDPIDIVESAPVDPIEMSDSVPSEPVEIDSEIKSNIYFVNTGRLNVRLKPGVSGKVVDFIDKGQKIKVLETKGDWARISQYFDGEGSVSTSGVALWVYAIHLSTDRPAATE